MKTDIAIFGGGSVNWCPGLLRDIYLIDSLEGGEIRLLDVDPEGLDAILGLEKPYNEISGKEFHFRKCESLEELLTGVDFVLSTFSPGSLEAYANDLEIPIAYGVRQPVSMTIGAPSISAALRTVPVAFELAESMTKFCPDAWLLNVTNPMTCVTTAMNLGNASGKVVGLCHEFEGQLEMVSEIAGVKPDKTQRANDFARITLNARVAGINHFIWLLGISHEGEDLYPKIREFGQNNDAWFPEGDRSKGQFTSSWGNNKEAKLALLNRFGYLPVAGDRHLIEFFGNMHNQQNQFGLAFNIRKTTMQERFRLKARNLDRARRIGLGEESPEWTRSSEQVTDIMEAVLTGRPSYCIANLPNSGQIANVDQGSVVETLGWFGPDGAKPDHCGHLPGAIAPMVRHHLEVDRITVEAALQGSRAKLKEALTIDLSSQLLDFRQIPNLADDLIQANKQWLPRFQ